MAALLTVLPASAQPVAQPNPASIGVEFDPYYNNQYDALNNTLVQGYAPNPYGYQAGALNQQSWNVANGQTGAGNGTTPSTLNNANLTYDLNGTYSPAAPVLLDSNGNATAVSFLLSNVAGLDHSNVNTSQSGGFGTGGVNAWYAVNGATPAYLMGGVQYSQSTVAPVTLSFSGLTSGDSYDLYAYVGSTWWSGSNPAAVTLGSQSYYLNTDSGSLSNYTQATAASAGSATTADYVEFTNVLGSTIQGNSLTVTGTGGAVGLSGFQLVDLGVVSVPEPSTVWMISLGLLGLMFHVYRQRHARA